MSLKFSSLCDLMVIVSPLKRKYPMINTYHRYLDKLKKGGQEDAMNKECLHVERFIRINKSSFSPDAPTPRTFQHAMMETNKPAIQLFWENVLSMGGADVVEKFWRQWDVIVGLFFPEGIPEKEDLLEEAGPDEETGAAAASSQLDLLMSRNPMLRDMYEQVKESASELSSGDCPDLVDMIQTPAFNNIVDKVKSQLDQKKYKMNDITRTISDIMGTLDVQKLDDSSRETMSAITNTMSSMEKGQMPDMTQLSRIWEKVSDTLHKKNGEDDL